MTRSHRGQHNLPPGGFVNRAAGFPKAHPFVAAGTLLGGLGAAAGAFFAGLALFVNSGDSSTPVTTATTPPPQYTYHRILDKTKTISLSVPEQWPNVDGLGWHAYGLPPIPKGKYVGPGIVAAPSIAKWNNDQKTPGVFVGVSKIVRRSYSPRDLLTKVEFFQCEASAIRKIETPTKSGGSIRWTCDGGERWYASAWWPPKTHRYVVYVQLKLVTTSDDEALQNILETLSVKPLP